MIVLIVFIILLGLILRTRWKNREFIKLSKLLKHDMVSLPILGIGYKSLGNNEDRMKQAQIVGQQALDNNGIFFAWFVFYPAVIIGDPELADYVLRTCLGKHEILENLFRPFFGSSSIFTHPDKWRPRRKLTSPIFSPKNLKQFVTIFADQSAIMVDQLQRSTGQPISIFDYLAKYALDSVCETTLGMKLNAQATTEPHPFATSIDHCARAVVTRFLQPWLHIDFIYKLLPMYRTFMGHKNYVYDFGNQLVKAKRQQMQEDNYENGQHVIKVKSILELMMEPSGQDQILTDEELLEETLGIIMAGTDTSAATAAFTALMLARHPEVQERVYEELRQELFDDTPVMTKNLPNLKYLEAVIKETLRLYPPVYGIIRKTDKEITLPSGVTLPENCMVAVHLAAINRNPKYWGPDAEEFRPDRFLDGSVKHAAQFATFSLGPRNCVGFQYAMMSIKTVLATLLRQYRVLPADPTRPHEPIRLAYGMLVKDVDNFMVRLEPRC